MTMRRWRSIHSCALRWMTRRGRLIRACAMRRTMRRSLLIRFPARRRSSPPPVLPAFSQVCSSDGFLVPKLAFGSAPKAQLHPSLGHRPRTGSQTRCRAPAARPHLPRMNRAFSAGGVCGPGCLGRCPRAGMTTRRWRSIHSCALRWMTGRGRLIRACAMRRTMRRWRLIRFPARRGSSPPHVLPAFAQGCSSDGFRNSYLFGGHCR